MGYSEYDRFKWEVLAHTPHRLGLEAPWFEASKLEPDDPAAQKALVVQVVRELFDEGLIFCAYASLEDGYQLDIGEFTPAAQDDLNLELARTGDYVEPEERLFWLLPTAAGLEMLNALPADAFPPREAPRFTDEEREEHFRAIERWVETGEGPPPFPWSRCPTTSCSS